MILDQDVTGLETIFHHSARSQLDLHTHADQAVTAASTRLIPETGIRTQTQPVINVNTVCLHCFILSSPY